MSATKLPRIDTHSHYLPPSLYEAMNAYTAKDATFARLNALMLSQGPDAKLRNAASRLAEMDAAEVAISVLSFPPPGLQFGSQENAARQARAANDELIAAAENAPGRFYVEVGLPLPFVEESIAELNRVASHRLVRGICLMTDSATWTLDEPRFDPIYARAGELGFPIMLHPSLEACPAAFGQWALTASLAPMVSSSLSALRLILSGTLDRVPNFTPIVPHLGGVIPYLSQRIDDLSGRGAATHALIHYLRTRLYYDTCSFHPPALRCACETVGTGRLMLGSDYPFRGAIERCVVDLEASDLSVEEKRAIAATTAAHLFRIDVR